jgi:hypothetical protein
VVAGETPATRRVVGRSGRGGEHLGGGAPDDVEGLLVVAHVLDVDDVDDRVVVPGRGVVAVEVHHLHLAQVIGAQEDHLHLAVLVLHVGDGVDVLPRSDLELRPAGELGVLAHHGDLVGAVEDRLDPGVEVAVELLGVHLAELAVDEDVDAGGGGDEVLHRVDLGGRHGVVLHRAVPGHGAGVELAVGLRGEEDVRLLALEVLPEERDDLGHVLLVERAELLGGALHHDEEGLLAVGVQELAGLDDLGGPVAQRAVRGADDDLELVGVVLGEGDALDVLRVVLLHELVAVAGVGGEVAHEKGEGGDHEVLLPAMPEHDSKANAA